MATCTLPTNATCGDYHFLATHHYALRESDRAGYVRSYICESSEACTLASMRAGEFGPSGLSRADDYAAWLTVNRKPTLVAEANAKFDAFLTMQQNAIKHGETRRNFGTDGRDRERTIYPTPTRRI